MNIDEFNEVTFIQDEKVLVSAAKLRKYIEQSNREQNTLISLEKDKRDRDEALQTYAWMTDDKNQTILELKKEILMLTAQLDLLDISGPTYVDLGQIIDKEA